MCVCVCKKKKCHEQNSDLDVGSRVDLVHSITWCSACLSVEVVALYKHGVVTHTAHPDITLTTTLQLHAFTYV